jgi:hypothetical protein
VAIMPIYPQSIIDTLRTKKERQTKLENKIKAPTPSIKADKKRQETQKEWTFERIVKRVIVIGRIIAIAIGLYLLIRKLRKRGKN